MLAIVDYQAGNQTSVARALGHLGIPCRVTADPQEMARARGVVFPGVGSAPNAMRSLRAAGMDVALAAAVGRGQSLLGICLGCQILLGESEEGPVRTLGLLPGVCRRFPPGLREENGEPIQIPHMGWNSLRIVRPSPLLAGIPPDAEFYFVHSYYACPQGEMTLATTMYGQEFCSVYGRDGLWAVQFHPEKSGAPGLRLLANFYNWCCGRA